jgi:mannose-6-phosphate isomerase-like protein (cupin superfamily)
MKVIKKHQTNRFENSKSCTAIEYPLGDKDINGSVVELDGRYPEKGMVTNSKCKELVYIIKGTGKLVVEESESKLEQGDLALIEPGEKYFFEGNLTMFMPCIPAWYPEQHKEINE